MLNNRGRTFTMAAYVIGGGFVLIVFGMVLATQFPTLAAQFDAMMSHYATISTVGLTALGARATVAEAKKSTPAEPQ